MDDTNFGNLNSRQLTLRWLVPFSFQRWNGGNWVFSPLRMLNPVRWWRAIRTRCNWSLWCGFYRDANHRCWCMTGSMFDGRLCVAGWGVVWFYSHFTGEVPCPCDKAVEEMELQEHAV